MSDAGPPDWTLVIGAAAAIGMVLGVVLLHMVARMIAGVRDGLRDRYVYESWNPSGMDLVLLPSWLLLEVFCLAFGLLYVVLVGLAAMSAANSVRDWWHEGDRTR